MDGRRAEPTLIAVDAGIVLFALALLVVAGLCAAGGRTADSRDDAYSLGRVMSRCRPGRR